MKKLVFFQILTVFLTLLLFSEARAQGPVIISGLDTEWGFRPANASHGTISMWSSVIQTGIINNVTSNPTGPILVIGGGKSPIDMMTSFWDQTAGALGKSVVYSNSITGDISTISFSGYSMIAICNTTAGSGTLTASELASISARQGDIANFVNSGGGLFASSCDIPPLYGYINIGTPPLISVNGSCSSGSVPTAAGASMGILPIVGPFHNSFSQFPSFLSVLSTCGGRDVILGGASVTIPSGDDGAYCCEGDNLVVNGNFESGLLGISTTYLNPPFGPGSYDVRNDANPFNATVTDHSFCVDSSLYPSNDMYMVVNGKTQQGGSSVIWEQAITGLDVGEEYKFCANFKDMEQCTFNIYPRITVNAGPFSSTQVIDTDDSDPCDWERIEICFTANNSSMNLQITLDETGNGDGNDLAIDDIALQQKLDPNYFITVQHQGNNNDIIGSLNTISNTDDTLLNEECESNDRDDYYWFVYEPLDPTAPLFSGIAPGTFGWSSNISWSGPGVNGPWGLTTNFPDYPFASNKFYVIGIYVPSCCESCYTDSFDYQITYNNGFAPANADDFSYEMKEDIKARFVKSEIDGLGSAEVMNQDRLSLYPNPAQESFNVSLLDDVIKQVEIISISGQVVYSVELNQDTSQEVVGISTLSSGMYFVNVTGDNQKRYTAKLIKE